MPPRTTPVDPESFDGDGPPCVYDPGFEPGKKLLEAKALIEPYSLSPKRKARSWTHTKDWSGEFWYEEEKEIVMAILSSGRPLIRLCHPYHDVGILGYILSVLLCNVPNIGEDRIASYEKLIRGRTAAAIIGDYIEWIFESLERFEQDSGYNWYDGYRPEPLRGPATGGVKDWVAEFPMPTKTILTRLIDVTTGCQFRAAELILRAPLNEGQTTWMEAGTDDAEVLQLVLSYPQFVNQLYPRTKPHDPYKKRWFEPEILPRECYDNEEDPPYVEQDAPYVNEDRSGNTMLHDAVDKLCPDKTWIKLLIAKGINVGAENDYDKTALRTLESRIEAIKYPVYGRRAVNRTCYGQYTSTGRPIELLDLLEQIRDMVLGQLLCDEVLKKLPEIEHIKYDLNTIDRSRVEEYGKIALSQLEKRIKRTKAGGPKEWADWSQVDAVEYTELEFLNRIHKIIREKILNIMLPPRAVSTLALRFNNVAPRGFMESDAGRDISDRIRAFAGIGPDKYRDKKGNSTLSKKPYTPKRRPLKKSRQGEGGSAPPSTL